MLTFEAVACSVEMLFIMTCIFTMMCTLNLQCISSYAEYITNTYTSTSLFCSGNAIADQIIRVLLGTHMFVAGVFACFLDNTIPGKDHIF